jgi:hypothetical protein
MRPNRMSTRVAACLATLSALAHDVAAQEAAPVRYDARVRVVALGRDGQPNRVLQVGELRQLDGDTVGIMVKGTLHRALVDSTRRLEVSYNSRRHTGSGALIGLAVGGFLGLAARAMTASAASGPRRATTSGRPSRDFSALSARASAR